MTTDAISTWFSRTDQGFWCNVCGDILRPDFYFDGPDEWDEYEDWLESDDGRCRTCGAPDEIDPEAI